MRLTGSLLLLLLFPFMHPIYSQIPLSANSGERSTYGLRVAVDEVVLTFHATDSHGLPVNNIGLSELGLLDNGKAPRAILDFQVFGNRPIRAGILMDESDSVGREVLLDRAISTQYIQRLLRQKTDLAFVMDFASQVQVAQPWTNDPNALLAGLRRYIDVGKHVYGTALFDALYRACRSQFAAVDHAESGNVLLLFTDGEDNHSRDSLDAAIRACQSTNTSIYAFREDSKTSFGYAGPKTLAELAEKTGGRVFHETGSEADVYSDLRLIEADFRSQYRLVYRPAELRHDGLFHHVSIKAPERVDSVLVRSGYYAPAR